MLRWVPLAFAATLVAVAGVLAVALQLGYDHWLAVANAASAKGNASDYLTPAVWAAITLKGTAVGVVLTLLAALVVWRRASITGYLQIAAEDAGRAGRDFSAWLGHIWCTDGKATWVGLGLITLGGIAIRLRDLGQPLRHDEALVFLNFVRRPLYLIVAMYNDVANHVFETVLKHGVWLLFGDAEWAIRLPVFIAGCLLAPVMYLVTRAAYGRTAALLAAAMVAGSSLFIEYSVNARGYELLALFILILMGLRHVLVRRDNAFLWLTLAVVSAFTFWTHPAAILSYGVVGIWLLSGILLRPDGQRWNGVRWLAAMCLLGALLTVILYSPILISSGAGHMNHMVARGQDDLRLGNPLIQLHTLGTAYTRNLPAALAVAMALAAVFGSVIEHWRNGKSGSLALAVVLWVGLYLSIFPMFGFVRLWLPHALFFYSLAALGLGWVIDRLPGRWSAIAAVSAALAVAVAGVGGEAREDFVRNNEDGTFFESRTVADDFSSRLAPGDAIYAPCPAAMPLMYGLLRHGVPVRVMTSNHSDEGGALQVLTLGPASGGATAWRPTGSLYVILTDTAASFDQAAGYLFGKTVPPAEAVVVHRFPHSTVYRLPMPDDFVLN